MSSQRPYPLQENRLTNGARNASTPAKLLQAAIVAGLLWPAQFALAGGAAVAHAQAESQTGPLVQSMAATGASGAADAADDTAPMAVVERFLDASGTGDMAGAMALLAPGFAYVDARPSACTAESPCTDLAALRRDLAMDRADRLAPTLVSDVWASAATVHAKVEERSWYRETIGVDRTITNVIVEVHDGKITSYVGTPDLADEQTRNFVAFHTGWTPELMALVR
jgi:ketosteroid isomerase-like protein